MTGAVTLRYRLFGLAIDSELALPELAAQNDVIAQSPPDLSIRIVDPTASENSGGYVLDIDQVARFTIIDGRSILIAPAAGAGEREIRLFLLGSAMGAALHQRGILPLHANAISIDGRAVAFMGRSGSGKSTLAAWFHDRGYPILADDVCVVRTEGEMRPMAYPGVPRLRLWQDALEASGRSTADHPPSFRTVDDERRKFDVPIPAIAVATEPLPLAALFTLEVADNIAIEPVKGANAVETISANTYRGGYIGQVGNFPAHLAACVQIARQIPMFRMCRPKDRSEFEAQCRSLLNFVSAL